MGLAKERLLSLIVMMYITASHPIDDEIQQLRVRMENNLESALCNLGTAEKIYREKILNETNKIRLPVGNTTEEIRRTICNITGDLKSLKAVKDVISEYKSITENTENFLTLFLLVLRNTTFAPSEHCDRDLTCLPAYDKKFTLLRIITSTGRWVKDFTGLEPSC